MNTGSQRGFYVFEPELTPLPLWQEGECSSGCGGGGRDLSLVVGREARPTPSRSEIFDGGAAPSFSLPEP